jgi:hypothetical protein
VVVSTSPTAFDTVTELGTSVRFDFNERISERVSGGTLETAFSISPRGGELRVDHGRRSLSVRPEGGFRAGLVYRVTLNAVIADLFGNQMTDPFELVFSTGAEPVPTTLAGEAWNRVTGQPVAGATIYAVGDDGLIHQSSADGDGIFAFRYLPPGDFSVTAFVDINRNGEVDSTEVQGAVPAEIAVGDTLLLEVVMLEPDTSAAVVTDALALDSVTIAVTFDDFLDPAVPESSMQVSLAREGGSAPAIDRVFHAGAYLEHVATVTDSLVRLDSIEALRAAIERAGIAVDTSAVADSVPALDSIPVPDSIPALDSVPPPADTIVVELGAVRGAPVQLPPLQGSRPGPTPDGRRVLPGRRVVIRLAEPLTPEIEYEVGVAGVVNITGVPGGGGVTPVVLELPSPDSTTADSLAVPDTAVVDTAVVDTAVVDTAVVDTAVVDTLGGAGNGRASVR